MTWLWHKISTSCIVSEPYGEYCTDTQQVFEVSPSPHCIFAALLVCDPMIVITKASISKIRLVGYLNFPDDKNEVFRHHFDLGHYNYVNNVAARMPFEQIQRLSYDYEYS